MLHSWLCNSGYGNVCIVYHTNNKNNSDVYKVGILLYDTTNKSNCDSHNVGSVYHTINKSNSDFFMVVRTFITLAQIT